MLIEIVREHLPVEVDDPGRTATWPVVGLALIARAAGTLEAMVELEPTDHPSDSATLARTLYEHVVHLAWLAAAPRPARLEEWQKDDLRRALVADKEMRERGGSGLLEPGEMAPLKARFKEMKGNPLNLADLALAADRYWAGKLPGIGEHTARESFRGIYAVIYRYTSTRAHPTYRGTNAVIKRLSDSRSRVHMERDDARAGYSLLGTGTIILSLALYVCNEVLGWHVRDRVNEIFERFPG
jgi:hypothetical protein